MLSNRYNRQILLKGFGKKGQDQLHQSKVLVIGAGGLGCPVLQILAASGIGHIGIVDNDRVSPDNLSRQILYSPENMGHLKTQSAARYLQKLNPEIQIEEFPVRLSNKNALEILKNFDILVDGTDNFESRYMINDAACLLGKPLVYGAVSEFEGQMAVWNLFKNGNQSINYRDAFPTPPHPGAFKNCNELGVLGVLTSIIGSMMAAETIKIASGVGEPFINRIWTYTLLNHRTYEFKIKPNPDSVKLIPKNEEAYLAMDYDSFCSVNPNKWMEISPDLVKEYMMEGNTLLLDVREPGELPQFKDFEHKNIPLSEIEIRSNEIQADRIITFCYSGKRSLMAAQILNKILDTDKTIYSLEGGLLNWPQND